MDIFNKDFVFVPINEKYVSRIANSVLFVVCFDIARTFVMFFSDLAKLHTML